MSSLRNRIVIISSATVIGALALSGLVTYKTVQTNMERNIAQNLTAIASANALTIDEWVNGKGRAVTAAAADVQHGDPSGLVDHMSRAAGFSITTVGWSDKTFFSTSKIPAGYDPTTRPWYRSAIAAAGLTLTRPYTDPSDNVSYVSFCAPIMRSGVASGAVSGAVSLAGIRAVISAVHPTPSSLAFVVSDDGQVVAYPDAKFDLMPVGKVSSALTPELLASIAQSSLPTYVSIGGVEKILKVQSVHGTNWLLVIALDKAEATSGLSDVLWGLGVATVLLTFLTVAISAYFTSNAFRGLSRVRDALDTIGTGGGDLTQRLPVIGTDEVAQISASFNAFVAEIGNVLQKVKLGVENVKSATGEIEMGNRDLSQRTETSASNLQQISSALTQLNSSVRNSAESAKSASQLANSASDAAARSGVVVTGAVSTMEQIAASSARINEIIAVIDGIAFQTNILALNAAVEAARAGEHGRGFAVVAGEVRSLAQRCSGAAREIKHLIAASEANVTAGTQHVKAAGSAMQELVSGIEHVSRVIEEIEAAVSEQSDGIGQIDRSMGEMDEATQQNAALVEESTAASATLNEQAHGLSDLVGIFQLG